MARDQANESACPKARERARARALSSSTRESNEERETKPPPLLRLLLPLHPLLHRRRRSSLPADTLTVSRPSGSFVFLREEQLRISRTPGILRWLARAILHMGCACPEI